LPIRDDGSLAPSTSTVQHKGNGPHPQWQKEAHVHSTYWIPKLGVDSAGMLIVAEQGSDRVYRYLVDDLASPMIRANENLLPLVTPAGTGPRHIAVDKNANRLYVLGELDATVSVTDISGKEPKIIQRISTLPPGVTVDACNNATAEISLHSNGKFLYASNRGHDTIVLFHRDPKSGKLTFIETVSSGGKNPRSFFISPCGCWMISANLDTHNIITLAINPETGQLKPTGKEINVGQPACVLPMLAH
jgi:6-phosphogluconolactonase